MYREWMKDSSSVHKSWDVYFRGVAAGAPVGQAYAAPPTLGSAPDYAGTHQAAAPVPISGGFSGVAGPGNDTSGCACCVLQLRLIPAWLCAVDDSRDKIGCLQLINGFRKVRAAC